MKKDPYAPLRSGMGKKPEFWRSIEHRDGDASVTEAVDMEFQGGLPGKIDRRDLLKGAGVSMAAAAALSGCEALPLRRPEEEILPFVRTPEKAIPGIRQRYATAMPRSEGAVGLLVEAHEGRPTKIEGNPLHPSSRGTSDVWAQVEVLRLYDPERARNPIHQGKPATWQMWDEFARDAVATWTQNGGQGIAVLAEEHDGPTFTRLIESFRGKYPKCKVYRWDPLVPDAAFLGSAIAFGSGVRVGYDLSQAKTIFALDSDFLNAGPEHLAHALEFGKSRAIMSKGDLDAMKRLYVAEGAWSVTGTNADHRLRIAPGLLPDVLKAVAGELSMELRVRMAEVEVAASTSHIDLPPDAKKFVSALAADLAAAGPAALVMVGPRQPATIHALAHAINAALGAKSPRGYRHSGETRVPMIDQLTSLRDSLLAGEVDTLITFDANPVYTAPGALDFGAALAKAATSIHISLTPDETGMASTWHLPQGHFLEVWGDVRAYDGTASATQPVIHPLFGARAGISIIAQLQGLDRTSDKDLLEDTWMGAGDGISTRDWRRGLHDGIIATSKFGAVDLTPNFAAIAMRMDTTAMAAPSLQALDVVAYFGNALDGRLNNVPWVMELPDPVSKLVWDNAALIAPTTARALAIEGSVKKNRYEGDVVELSAQGRSITIPIFVMPGLAENTLVVNCGFGRKIGEVSKGVGVNIYPLLQRDFQVRNVTLKKVGRKETLCSTQDYFSMPGNPYKQLSFTEMLAQAKGAPERTLGLATRPHVRSGTATEFAAGETAVSHKGNIEEVYLGPTEGETRPEQPIQLVKPITYEGQQWGMVIDLSSCIGCNACTIACIAENNIPTVGREQVLLGREMHWIRLDRYFTGDVEEPIAVHQPLTCMQCENAPCEPVCPVAATVHDDEGLNAMAYNRCIGTRYCSNNCPYKVRRFNYLDYTHTGNVYVAPYWKERMKTLSLQRNPDVTVRYRGTMEKCTYCTQRIEEAKVAAKRNGNDRKALPDGAVKPACAQACPAQAITFGNINDEASKVAALKKSPRNYEVLQELNTRPRTTYLARVRNENEALS